MKNYIKLYSWFLAIRLRTLLLSLSSICMGTFLSIQDNCFSWKILLLSLITSCFYQILSNFANDLGDGVKGIDKNRVGPKRALASHDLNIKEFKIAIIFLVIISLLSTVFLLYISFTPKDYFNILIFLILGVISILAAIFYTLGNNPYGYMGLGDIFVFIFFGWIGVIGSYFLYTKTWKLITFLPASAIGCLCTSVLHLNNMRDIKNDKKLGKNTFAVKIGIKYSKIYLLILLNIPIFLMLIYIIITNNYNLNYKYFIFMISFFSFFPIQFKILIKRRKEIDLYLRSIIFSTFFFVISFGLNIFYIKYL